MDRFNELEAFDKLERERDESNSSTWVQLVSSELKVWTAFRIIRTAK